MTAHNRHIATFRLLKSGLLVLVLLVVTAGVAPGQGTQAYPPDQAGIMTVPSLGKSSQGLAMERGNEEAVADGLHQCLLKAIKDIIGEENTRSHLDVIQRKFLSHATSYVMTFSEISSWRKDRIYWVKLSCKIHQKTIREQIEYLGLLMSEEELPRILVVVGEKRKGESQFYLTWKPVISEEGVETFPVSVADQAVIDVLAEKGIASGDRNVFARTVEIEQFFSSADGRFRDLEKVFTEADADIIVYGTTEIHSAGWISSTRQKATARTKLFATNLKTGTFISTVTIDGDGISTEGVNTAGETAIRRTTGAALRRLLPDVLTAWSKQVQQYNHLDLIIQDVRSYSDLEMIKTTIQSRIEGIGNLYEKVLATGTITLRIETKFSTEELAKKLTGAGFGHFKLGLIGVDHNSIRVAFSRM
jgi:hypothetical protein